MCRRNTAAAVELADPLGKLVFFWKSKELYTIMGRRRVLVSVVMA